MPYLTPNSVPEGDICRPLFIPASSDWLAIVSGALTELTKTWNWEQFGTVTVEEAVTTMKEMVERYYEEACMDCDEILACVYPEGMLERFDEDGTLQTSTDGGETWTDATNRDPRFVGTRVTLSTGIDCDDVKAIVGFIEGSIDAIKDQLDISASIGGLVVVILGALAGVLSGGAATALGIAFAGAVASSSSALISAAITTEVLQRLVCNLLTALDGKTTVTEADYEAIRNQLAIDETGLAYTVLWHAITNMGAVGLQNSIALQYTSSVESYDCVNCEAWCYEFDFTSANGGFSTGGYQTIGADGNGRDMGVYVTSTGWRYEDYSFNGTWKDRGVSIYKEFGASAHVTRVVMTYDRTTSGANVWENWITDGDGNIFIDNTVQGSNQILEWMGDETIDQIGVGVWASGNVTAYGGNALIKTLRLEGYGENPFGENNCV